MTTNIAWFSFIIGNNTSADELRPCHLGLLYGSRDGIISAIPFLVRYAYADDTSVLAVVGLVVLAAGETVLGPLLLQTGVDPSQVHVHSPLQMHDPPPWHEALQPAATRKHIHIIAI